MSAHRSTGLFGKLRFRLIAYALIAAAAILLRTGCAAQNTTPQPADAANNDTGPVFTSAEYDIRLPYPDALQLRHNFGSGYLATDSWKTYAGAHPAPGQQLVALVMPHSNEVTTGALRIGVSRDPAALKSCTTLPAAALAQSVDQTTIDGVRFTTYTARDAGMSHYLIVHSYRAVHAHTCYAMDVLVYGTNPKVYDPPRTPPFTHEQVFTRLQPVAEKLQFVATGAAGATN